MNRITRLAGAAAVALLALGLAGCNDAQDKPDNGTAPASSSPTADLPAADGVTVDITVGADGKVTPQGRRVEVKRGEKITLHITAKTDEEIHVHSDPEHEYEVKAGDDVSHSFTIKTPGQVAVEAHHADAVIAQLVVR